MSRIRQLTPVPADSFSQDEEPTRPTGSSNDLDVTLGQLMAASVTHSKQIADLDKKLSKLSRHQSKVTAAYVAILLALAEVLPRLLVHH